MTDPRDAHGGHLTIDLAALAANWRSLAARSGAAEAGAVVKADGYGCGIEAVVPALTKAGARTFFVAHLSEGLRARAAAPEATIYVLNGLPPGCAPAFAEARLRPVLGSGAEVAEWTSAFPGLTAPAALHIDTGMNRLGLRPEEIGDLPAVFRPALVMSHFVASEEPSDEANARQIAAFRNVTSVIPDVPASLCNSSGLFLDVPIPIHFALTRPGYALYGGNPTPGRANPMRPVVRLEASVVQVRHVGRGETVGYNGQWTAKRDTRIATLSLGYADGYLRSGSATDAKPGGMVLFDGRPAPFAGRVSMDLITVDVTELPDVARGARATVIGDALDVDTVAARLGTNGYEVLTGLGRRYARSFTS